jgi:hypothetical protein
LSFPPGVRPERPPEQVKKVWFSVQADGR